MPLNKKIWKLTKQNKLIVTLFEMSEIIRKLIDRLERLLIQNPNRGFEYCCGEFLCKFCDNSDLSQKY